MNDELKPVSPGEATRAWARVAALSFGGPAGQIAVMHRVIVEEKGWVSDSRFMHALNYCMVLPGPEAQQLATYLGWLLHGWRGGLVAGGLFILPGFVSILLLSVLYAGFHEAPAVQALFFGIKAAVLAVIAQAIFRLGRKALRTGPQVILAAAAFIALFFFAVPFPWVILGAAIAGVWMARSFTPDAGAAVQSGQGRPADRVSGWRTARVLSVGLALWMAPVLALWVALGPEDVFTRLGLFFSKMAVVSFGGAYSVLAYVAQEAVQTHGWLSPGEMLDGLGMAETTPGPLIQVVQFVGFMGGYRDAGDLSPMLGGVLASVLVTWVTFVPSFLWIFMGAPYIETLRGNRTLQAALAAVTAAVVGVMLNLAAWFSVHVLFAHVDTRSFGPLQLVVPEPASVQWLALVLAAGAFLAMARFRAGMLPVIGVSAVLGAGAYLALPGLVTG
ncbi:chromate efflux transporter [Marinihelvus fidelis]|uniref:chromate efflux transporter n=1 Tax=Marinihelvus fidelis TaxID=2613842 RepID=UPI001CD6BD20|nr:chromate efflux transporter [Marinihelvus fidelis]